MEISREEKQREREGMDCAGTESDAIFDMLYRAEDATERLAADKDTAYDLVRRQKTNENLACYLAGMVLQKRRLLLAKPGHGSFGAELKEVCPIYGFSPATCYRYMSFYRRMSRDISYLITTKLSPAALELLGDPVEHFDNLVASENRGDDETAKLNNLIKMVKEQVKAASPGKSHAKVISINKKFVKDRVEDLDRAVTKLTSEMGQKDFATMVADFVIRQAEIQPALPVAGSWEVQIA